MDGETFYYEFKRALDYFNLKWAEKDKITVHIHAGQLTFKHGYLTCSVKLPDLAQPPNGVEYYD